MNFVVVAGIILFFGLIVVPIMLYLKSRKSMTYNGRYLSLPSRDLIRLYNTLPEDSQRIYNLKHVLYNLEVASGLGRYDIKYEFSNHNGYSFGTISPYSVSTSLRPILEMRDEIKSIKGEYNRQKQELSMSMGDATLATEALDALRQENRLLRRLD